MDNAKRRRLAKLGWKEGTVAELLGLTPEESALIELKLRLGQGLRKRREKQGLTQKELAHLVGSSQSRVAKMELGDPSVTLDLTIRALLALGASGRELGKIISSAA